MNRGNVRVLLLIVVGEFTLKFIQKNLSNSVRVLNYISKFQRYLLTLMEQK